MDGPGIQRRVDRGFAKAAQIAGFPYQHYRPSDRINPLRLLDRLADVRAVFDARPALKFNNPPNHGDFLRYALVDGTDMRRGDYLVSDADVLFVADRPPFYATTCVLCNSVLSLHREAAAGGFGAIEDPSDDSTTETTLFAGWPGSMLFSGRGRDAMPVPGDLPNPEYLVHLPAIPGSPDPQGGDVLLDDRGHRYSVGWWEHGALGWRIIARLLTVT